MRNDMIKRSRLMASVCALVIATAVAPTSLSYARGAGVGAGGSVGAGAMGGASGSGGATIHSNAGAATNANTNAGVGGNSSIHMSTQGTANTNGPNAADRDFGKDRAEDRADAHGLKHLTAHHHKGNTVGKSEREITDDLNSLQLHGAANTHTGGHI